MVERYFLPLAFVLSGIALIYPPMFMWGKTFIPYLLGIIMFGMGLTLETTDFLNVWRNARVILLGVLAQYTVMPLLAVGLSMLFQLPKAVFVGMVLLGACPGGTASNVIVYLSKGNVSLSVTMTLVSTLLAPVLTPTIVYLAARRIVDIPFLGMVESVFWIIVFPIIGGIILRRLFHAYVKPLTNIFPSISMLTIAFVIAVIMGLNQKTVLHFPFLILLAVILHNLLGLGVGYVVGKLFSCSLQDCRAIAIEVGMQNSGLGVSLAATFFSAQSALPSALFSLWHNFSGICLADYWSGRRES